MWLEGYLKDHKKRLLEEKVLKYKCNDCDKAFTIISHWSSLLMNTNKSNQAIREHTAAIHEGKKYPCQICGLKFTAIQSVTIHKRRIHGLKFFSCSHYKLFRY